MKKNVLLTGGAGYIGSHNVRAFKAHGEEVIVIENGKLKIKCERSHAPRWVQKVLYRPLIINYPLSITHKVRL